MNNTDRYNSFQMLVRLSFFIFSSPSDELGDYIPCSFNRIMVRKTKKAIRYNRGQTNVDLFFHVKMVVFRVGKMIKSIPEFEFVDVKMSLYVCSFSWIYRDDSENDFFAGKRGNEPL